MLRMYLDLVGPDSGEIYAFGLPIPAQVYEVKNRLGVLTQLDNLDRISPASKTCACMGVTSVCQGWSKSVFRNCANLLLFNGKPIRNLPGFPVE